MSLDSFFDFPLLVTALGTILVLALYGVGGLVFVRRRVLPRWRVRVEDSEFIGTMVQAVMVFYGLAVALIAVSVWQTHSEVSNIVSQEAVAIATLSRDANAYPAPIRSELQQALREYLQYVIHDAWPQQRQRGKTRGRGVVFMDRFQATLAAFEPVTEGQKLLHAETLRAFNQMILARRLRLDAADTALPGVMWLVIVAGAFISLSSSFFFKVEDVRLHGVLVILLATFIGLVIFMISALDRPFHGQLGLGTESYQVVLERLMTR